MVGGVENWGRTFGDGGGECCEHGLVFWASVCVFASDRETEMCGVDV